jgi:CheY-like chemotaxis protein
MDNKARPIIIVEDDTDDAELFRRLLQRVEAVNPLAVFSSGEDAITYLTNVTGGGAEDSTALPLLVFLDLKTPVFDGQEILHWIREHDVFDRMSVVICSGSANPEDYLEAAKHGAQAFVPKFPTPDELMDILRAAERFASGRREPFGVASNRLPGVHQ